MRADLTERVRLGTNILIAGDITAEEAKSALDKSVGAWKAFPLNIARPDLPPLPESKELRVVVVNRPDAVQTVIQFLLPGPKFSDQYRIHYRCPRRFK